MKLVRAARRTPQRAIPLQLRSALFAFAVRSIVLAIVVPAVARAEDAAPAPAPPTFTYTLEADPDYVRALLEMTSVLTVGFIWYVTQTDIAKDDYDVNYSWPVFRKKLSGESIGLDTNHFGTNFIGHPLGGTGYYLATRSNRLSIPAAFGLTFSGSLFWEYFGEVSERVSLNDMIVTPTAGIAIGEPLIQLGAFFDRSSPALRNRILAAVFAPLKSLNDLFDGLTPARAKHYDRNGFPLDEWHSFDLGAGLAATFADPLETGLPSPATLEYRFGLASRLVRLPGHDADRASGPFTDANVSSMTIAGAFTNDGLVDFEFATEAVLAGYYARSGPWSRELWGSGTLIGLATGYEYSLHDYDRDVDRPLDRISSVRIGLVLEQTSVVGDSRVFARIGVHACFGGVTPYALPEFGDPTNAPELPPITQYRQYYFGAGGCAAGVLGAGSGPFEALVLLRYESFTLLDGDVGGADQRMRLAARAGSAIPGTPLRLTAFVERRDRSGELGAARAKRGELSVGLDVGARF